MRLAFVYIAEAYQFYHAAAVMFDLMQREGVEVDIFHVDPAFPEHLERLRLAHGMEALSSEELSAGLVGKAIKSVKLLGLAKPQVLAANEKRLARYDAVISTEDGIARLFAGHPAASRPARIVITHGAGTRYFPSLPQMAKCDLVVAKGPRDAETYVENTSLNREQVVAGGYPKLVTTGLLATSRDPLFANANPVVLYNPHKEPKQRSWDAFFQPLLDGFRHDRSRNLIVAPHVKMFRRRSEKVREKLRALSDENILVDPASPSLLDNTYTEAADIYVGDVSSQVVEFLARPRPCVFLNAHGLDWQEDPHYAMWHMGEVIDDPAELIPAIERAPRLHERFATRQAAFAASALGDTSERSVRMSADAIEEFVREWKAA
ncbi:hypothetical protein K3152_04385 [Qipengyuania sp. 1NDH17]|uniref:Glycosyl transferase n=1 Tax=Qipengyuania polymorpha TaxID=2867234 RepID=A0ABS7IVI1_9SPHN|nr:hypothetical protein [Qipengyuania polymorpha]MBX7457477.1 hypothetical protein [Qipengyuania polymorpha]